MMTPEQLKLLFDGGAIMFIFAWGVACKYLTWLKFVPNALIPWIGSIGYILTRLAVPDAQAQGLDSTMVTTGQTAVIHATTGIVIGGFTNAVWASQLWERFGRAAIEWVSLRFTKRRHPGEDISQRAANARAAE